MRRGFTLIELLVVIAIIGLLVAITLPALSAARKTAEGSKCMANLHNLVQGCHLYLVDSKDYFPFPNSMTMESVLPPTDPAYWRAAGWLYDFRSPTFVRDQTMSADERHHGLLWYYLNSDEVYRCPADKAPWQIGPTQNLTSYMMSTVIRGTPDMVSPSIKQTLFRSDGIFMWEANEEGPADTFNDGNDDPIADPGNNQGVSRRHNFSGSIGCFDGHAEMMSTQQYYLESQNHPGRLWCVPGLADGGHSGS